MFWTQQATWFRMPTKINRDAAGIAARNHNAKQDLQLAGPKEKLEKA